MRALAVPIILIALTFPAQADPNCTFRARGKTFELGQSTCLPSPKGPRIATCGMVLNNTSWQFSDAPCVISRRAPVVQQSAVRGGQVTVASRIPTAP
jgi:hypothetical protein